MGKAPLVLRRTAIIAIVVTLFIFLYLRMQVLSKSSAELARVTPRGMVALQLAATPTQAEQILRTWSHTERSAPPSATLLDAAAENLAHDGSVILAYALVAIAVVFALRWWSQREARMDWLLWSIGITGVGAALFDLLENFSLARMLTEFQLRGALVDTRWLTSAVNCCAVAKFILLLGSMLLGLVGLIATIRRGWLRPGGERPFATGSFKELYLREVASLKASNDWAEQYETDVHEEMGPAREPWLRTPKVDHVGLAFSGGGIRSATFNLGVLQGLHSLGLLSLFDYFTTISGGGYIGGWWTAWRKRHPDADFPTGRDGVQQEAEEIRHLREFSMFLSPRWGFFETEMWNGLVAISSGMLPTLTMAFCLLANAVFCFLLSTAYHLWPFRIVGIVTFLIASFLIVVMCERAWKQSGKGSTDSVGRRTFWATMLGALVVAPAVWLGWSALIQRLARGSEWPVVIGGKFVSVRHPGTWDGWWELLGLRVPTEGFFLSPRLFDFAVVWLVTGLIIAFFRAAMQSIGPVAYQRSMLPPFDRVLQRFLAAGLAWLAIAIIWHAALMVAQSAVQLTLTAGGAAGGATLFALLRNWMRTAVQAAQERRLVTRLKPRLPQILAYVTVALAAIAVSALMIFVLRDRWWSWYLFAGGTWLLLGLSLFLNPTEVALHSFYRSRLARAYLGASNPEFATAETNRQTDVAAKDDLRLPDLIDPITKFCRPPIHLICCAANDLAGDHLANLGRGSRSAVLSCHGLSIGDHWAERPFIRFSSAMTASAAAFNSHMGSVSRHLGPAVSFLMSALNLRLGLWVRHPAIEKDVVPLFPGLMLLREMVNQTRCGLREVDGKVKPTAADVHLSDGAHFENLGLYELVRRHCRYILVTDCGADADGEFSDFGNALRRIREDFNVEIEIDLSPLKPNGERRAPQHMVVGTIHYDLVADKGVLLLLKPNLTGDEPSDVLQYATENEDFPQETTLDQFYDEAQWEAYRRLGAHSLRSGLRFVEKFPSHRPRSAQRVFSEARWEWYAKPKDFDERFLNLTERCAALDAAVQASGCKPLISQVYPEWFAAAHDNPDPTPVPFAADDHLASLHLLLQATQLMEDVWLGCQLDAYFNHPMNLGWMNYFQRWAYTPVYRAWWLVLRPIFSPGFRRFAENHWGLDAPARGANAQLRHHQQTMPSGLAQNWWVNRLLLPLPIGHEIFDYTLRLPSPDRSEQQLNLQAGLAAVALQIGPSGKPVVASWTSDQFFVPPSLWASGIGSAFLPELLRRLRKDFQVSRCEVTLKLREGRTDAGTRQERIDLIEFYKSNNFRPLQGNGDVLTWFAS